MADEDDRGWRLARDAESYEEDKELQHSQTKALVSIAFSLDRIGNLLSTLVQQNRGDY